MTKLIDLLAIIVITLLFSCSPVQTSGTISDVDIDIAMFQGTVVDSVESTVENVIVQLYDLEISDKMAIDTAVSNSRGTYVFDSISVGNYHIVANYDDTLSAGLWNLEVETIQDSVILVDTLHLTNTGTIMGNVENYDGYGLVRVYIPGTSYMASVDSLGDFIISWVAPASNYIVAFDRYGYAPLQISNISVVINDTTEISSVSLTPNEFPRNLSFDYDTSKNIVTINWDPMDRPDIYGYNIYRKDTLASGIAMDQVNTDIVMGTELVDTLDPRLFSWSDSICFKYQIRGVTKEFENETGKSRPVFVNTHIERKGEQKISVLTPTLGEKLSGYNFYNITWDFTGSIDSVRLDFSLDGGESWNPMSGNVKNHGIYQWPVYNASSTQCQIRVKNCEDSLIYSLSEFFEITAQSTDNLIKNGDFSEGFAYWNPKSTCGAKAVFDVDEGNLHTTITAIGENSWDVCFFQGPIHLKKNYLYEVSFRAKSSIERTYEASLNKMDKGEYLGGHHGTITTEWKEYTLPVSIYYGEDEKNGGLNFVVGTELGDVWFDDISMKVIGPK